MENFLAKVKESDFEIISIERKNGNEFAPKLFDLTGLCIAIQNLAADETLKIVQTL
jgi:DNA topoisomerase-3